MARFVVTDDFWGHIFSQAEGEVMTRFVYDRETEKMVFADVPGGFSEQGEWRTEASPEMLANLEDSLKYANEDALANPEDWGLSEADEMPDWAVPDTPGFGR